MRALAILFVLLGTTAWAEVEISGGGSTNSAVAEFKRIGEDSLQVLANRKETSWTVFKFSARVAQQKFLRSRIESTQADLWLDGVDVSAISDPTENFIIFEEGTWASLDKTARIQLVLHEILALTHRNVIDDSDYLASRALTELTLRTGVENAALSMASANVFSKDRPRVQTERTRILGTWENGSGEEGLITEVYIQTFENSSDEAVRIYQVFEDQTGAIIRIEYTDSEGPVGPQPTAQHP